jgi:hypothetical protein
MVKFLQKGLSLDFSQQGPQSALQDLPLRSGMRGFQRPLQQPVVYVGGDFSHNGRIHHRHAYPTQSVR